MADNDLETKHLETLDRDLGRFSSLETASSYVTKPLVAPALALIFIIIVGILAATTLSVLVTRLSLSSRQCSALTWL